MTDADGRLPESTRPGRSVLTVADEASTIAFYRDVIGFDVLAREPTVLGAGGTPLLEVRHDADARPRPRAAAGLFHNAFVLPDRAALGDALARIRDRGALSGASDHGVSEALYCRDPEGNGVELYRDRPREEWPRDDDGIRIGSWPLDVEALAADADGEASDRVPARTRLGHVHLEVTAIDRAREFYAETLGFSVVDSSPSAVFLAAGDYHHHLGLNAWNGRSGPAESGARGLAWFELVVPDGAVEGVRRRLDAAGAATSTRGDGFEVVDPDGIRLRIVAESEAGDPGKP
ncbi:VOC family protein [Saliphagus infecundisoli]|uniref:VOC family protein n=1 Tax=Saliphagus infecundisoli TaxID=1849069 RepID=A0ABD5QJR1_9EURY|nr:VOC family protein [Saliphagus infecundisoli]